MLIVAGTFTVKPHKIDEAIAAMQEMAAATQREEGCIHYQFYQDITHSSTFLVYERWQSAEALAAHMDTPHMAQLRSKIPDLLARLPEVKRYEATEIESS